MIIMIDLFIIEKKMATHSSILAWRIPWTVEPGGLQSMGLQSQTRLSRLIYNSPKLETNQMFISRRIDFFTMECTHACSVVSVVSNSLQPHGL